MYVCMYMYMQLGQLIILFLEFFFHLLNPFPLYSISSCHNRLDGPLSDCEFTSFFALLKRAFDSLNDRKGDVNKVTEVVNAFLVSSNTCNTCTLGIYIFKQTTFSGLLTTNVWRVLILAFPKNQPFSFN